MYLFVCLFVSLFLLFSHIYQVKFLKKIYDLLVLVVAVAVVVVVVAVVVAVAVVAVVVVVVVVVA